MGRQLDLRHLIPQDDEKPTILMPDGQEFVLPTIGIKEMGRLLMIEEDMTAAESFTALAASNDRIITMIRDANPGKEVPDYDLPVDALMELVAFLAGAEGGASQVVREALSRGGGEQVSDEDAANAARQLAAAAGTRDVEDNGPLASRKPSQKRSSRSGTSGGGGRPGGKKSRGQSSKRTSTRRSASKTG